MLNDILKTLQNILTEKITELAVLRLLADNPHLTRTELAGKIGLSDNGVKKIISNMKASVWIERKGSNKTGYRQIFYNLNGD